MSMDLIWNSSSIDKQLLWNNEKIIVFQNLFKNASAVPKFAVFFDFLVTKYFKKYSKYWENLMLYWLTFYSLSFCIIIYSISSLLPYIFFKAWFYLTASTWSKFLFRKGNCEIFNNFSLYPKYYYLCVYLKDGHGKRASVNKKILNLDFCAKS
jgi:hypothetical protein